MIVRSQVGSDEIHGIADREFLIEFVLEKSVYGVCIPPAQSKIELIHERKQQVEVN
ncbi:MAG: hypothetical protein K0R65_1127 [Crocinitomicaceae bacterium]|nr:hypothetical protein [Crocinitomicaceae bacterium]